MTRRVLVSPKPEEPLDKESLREWFRRSVVAWASQIFETFTFLINHAPDHELNEDEVDAGVTPSDYRYPPGDVRRYGAVGDGTTDDTAAIQRAIDVGKAVHFYDGNYRCVGLTGSTNLQRFFAHGDVSLRKNGNGVILTHSGNDIVLQGIQFRGESASFTGNNVNLTGERPTLLACSSRDSAATALRATGNRVRVLGSCDIYQTAAAGGSDYDIDIGTSGVATLYHVLGDFNSSQSTGGIRFTDCGGQSISDVQFGKLSILSGTSPVGVNGGKYTGNRILGDVEVEISGSVFNGNQFGTVNVHWLSGTSGHLFDTNTMQSGATLDDDSTNSYIVDNREAVPTAYTPAWTASVDPAIGDGSIVGRYTKIAREVSVSIDLIAGSTTTFGTGAWYFSLPYVPTTALSWIGSADIFDAGTNIRVGSVRTLTDGTARCIVHADSDTAQLDSARPMAWASGDRLRLSVTYFT
jgi:hypothetical protein